MNSSLGLVVTLIATAGRTGRCWLALTNPTVGQFPWDSRCAILISKFDRVALWRNPDSNIWDAKELVPECLCSDVREPMGYSQALMVPRA